MTKPSSFSCDKRFYGDASFPYGLSRSGEFTIQQVSLLEQHGIAYEALHNGQRTPINDEERAFVCVCRGEKKAESMHEITWQRYCDKTQKTIVPSVLSGLQSEKLIDEPTGDEDF